VSNLKQDKKIVAYTGQRIAREYMMYLRVDYQLKKGANKLQPRLIHLNKTLIYDANFILGKAEEELRIQQSLREEAARLILLHLRYAKN
jgi:outer membrane lipopolysaccharide assembly protein LptE/RlpB